MASQDIPTTLASLEAFANLNSALRDKAVAVLQECGSVINYERNMVLFSEQDSEVDMGLVVLEGSFRVIKPDGFEIEGHTPELLGELGNLSPNKRRTATVVTTSTLKGLRFSWKTFEEKAAAVMTEAEQETLQTVIREYAWNHFVG